MKTERISLKNLLRRILSRDSLSIELRRDLAGTLSEQDTLVAWEGTLRIMQAMCKSGAFRWMGVTEKDGRRYIRFRDPGS